MLKKDKSMILLESMDSPVLEEIFNLDLGIFLTKIFLKTFFQALILKDLELELEHFVEGHNVISP